MAYCRFGADSDVYLYAHINGGWHCSGCSIDKREPLMKSAQEALDHLRVHVKNGEKVPRHAIRRLQNEIGTSSPASGERGLLTE